MTLQDLENIFAVQIQIRELNCKIQAAYNTYHSPAFNGIGTRKSSGPSDPVTAAFHLLERLDEQKAECLSIWLDFEKKIEDFPADIQAIIRWKYLLPDERSKSRTWDNVNKHVYGYPDRFYSRQKLLKFLGHQKEDTKAE